VVPGTFMALYSFKMTEHECSERMCDNLKSHLYADNLTVLASHERTSSSVLGNFIHDIHSG